MTTKKATKAKDYPDYQNQETIPSIGTIHYQELKYIEVDRPQ